MCPPEQSHGNTAVGGPDAENDLQRHLHVYIRGLQFPDEATHVALWALQRQVLHRLPVRMIHVGGTRGVIWSIDRIVQRHACITWGVEFIRAIFFIFFFYV